MILTEFAVLVGTLVVEVQLETLVQEGQFAQAVGQDVVLVFGGVGEDLRIGLEGDDRTAVGALADDLDGRGRGALAVGLAEDLPVAADLGDEQRREGVHARDAHAVETSRDLVAALVELASGVQHGQHDLEGRLALLFVEVGRDTAAVVPDGDGVVFVDRHVDIGAEAGEGFVDRVVDHLVDQVVEALFADVADVHRRAFAHGFESFEDLDI